MEKDKYSWDFFLAHAGPDTPGAEELFGLLTDRAKVFLDTKCLLLGDNWDLKIALAQTESLVTVVLVSSHTGAAYYQRDEIAAAVAMTRADGDRHRIVPLFLEGAPLRIPPGLRTIHGIDVCAVGGLRQAALQLLELLERLTSTFGPPIHVDVTSRNASLPRGHNGPAIPVDVRPDQKVLLQIAQELPRSRGVVIAGPSGSGKTTTAYTFLCSKNFAGPFRERWYVDCRQPDIPSINHLDDSSIVVFDQVSAGHPCLIGSNKTGSIRTCHAMMIIVADDENAARVAVSILRLRASETLEAIMISPLSLEAWQAKLACFSDCHDSTWAERSWKIFEGKPRFLAWLLQIEGECRNSAEVERETNLDSQVALLSSWCDLHEGPLLEVIAVLVTLPFIGMSLGALAHVLEMGMDPTTSLVQKLADEGILVANLREEEGSDPLLMVHDLFRRILLARPQYPERETAWRGRYKEWLETVNDGTSESQSVSAMARLDAWIAGMYEIFEAPREEFLGKLRQHCEKLGALNKETAGSPARQRFVRNAMPLNGNLLSQLKKRLEQRDDSGEYLVSCRPLIGFYKAAAVHLEPSIELARIVFAGAMRDDAYVSFQAITNAATIWYRRGNRVAESEGYRAIINWFKESARQWEGSKRHVDHDYAAAFGALRLLHLKEESAEFISEVLHLREQYCISGVGLLTHMALLLTIGDLADRARLEAYLDQYGERVNAGIRLELRVTGSTEELALEPASVYVEKYLRRKYPDLSMRWWPPAGNLMEVDLQGKIRAQDNWLGDVTTVSNLSRSDEFTRFLNREIGSLGAGL